MNAAGTATVNVYATAKHHVSSLGERQKGWVALVVLVGVVLRFVASTRGHNFDFESYRIVANAHRYGKTAWETDRYNYGPIWWHLLRLFEFLSIKFSIGFRFQIITLLTIADLLIAYFIWHVAGLVKGCIFFLNPVSIVITGFHNQFDNLSIAIICIAILLILEEKSSTLTSVDLVVVLLLGLSLSTKHVFAFFIVWIASRDWTLERRVLYSIGPPVLFIAGFVPYWGDSHESIMRNVFEYRSFNDAPFLHVLGFGDGIGPLSPFILFVASVCLVGYLTRNLKLVDHFFLYTVVLVAFSNSLALQYLAIAAFGAVGLMNLAFAAYLLYAFAWISIEGAGLNVGVTNIPYGEFVQKFDTQPLPITLVSGALLFGWFLNRAPVETSVSQ